MRIIRLTILFNLWFGVLTSYSQNIDCKDFRSGKFKLFEDRNKTEYLIERNDTIQKETNLRTGQISKYRIYWESDCKFTLTIIEGRKEIMDYYKNKKLHIEIIEIYKDGYKFSAKIDGIEQLMYQIVKKVE